MGNVQNLLENSKTDVEIYIVGGYVRDRMLGRECKDHDFVVVGATVNEMLTAGFNQVGADFPVFLNEIGDEFALARTERKTGPGYQGFEVDASTSVTLEADLIRRDLTINAMARKVIGWNDQHHAKLSDEIIDPHGGQQDLAVGIIRHVSPAFAEDPLRVLRALRFACRYDFDIAPETYELMDQMAMAGELDHLVPERIVSEVERAIMEDHPHKFFDIMPGGCWDAVFPEYDMAYDMLQRVAWNKESRLVRWGAFWFNTIHPETQTMLMDRLGMPNDVRQLVNDINIIREQRTLNHTDALDVIKRTNAIAQPNRLQNLFDVFNHTDDTRVITFIGVTMDAARVASTIGFNALPASQRNTLKGKEIGQAIDELRSFKIEELFAKHY